MELVTHCKHSNVLPRKGEDWYAFLIYILSFSVGSGTLKKYRGGGTAVILKKNAVAVTVAVKVPRYYRGSGTICVT
jgi:hypothetical protein